MKTIKRILITLLSATMLLTSATSVCSATSEEENITVINITHYMDEAALADRVVILNDGRLIMDGTPDEVFSRQNELLALGLDVPQSTAFANMLREAGIKLSGSTVTPEACAEAVIAALKERA